MDLDHLPVHRTTAGQSRDPNLHAGQGLCAGEAGSFGSLAADGIDGCLTVFSEVFEAFDRLEAEAAKERQGGVAQGSEHLRGMADVGSPLILAAGDITDVMQL